MPKRSLTSAVMRWPNVEEVRTAFEIWARTVRERHPEILRIGAFGSYCRGNWGVGSDLDVIIVLRWTAQPFFSRLLDVSDEGLPVPADILVYTEEELQLMRQHGSRFVRELDEIASWVE
jgi:uncharacterized protein